MQKLPVQEKQECIQAAGEKMTSFNQLQVWKLTELPQGKHAIESNSELRGIQVECGENGSVLLNQSL